MSPEPPYPPISDYALLSDAHTAALVSRAGSIDWLCLPRFDSPAVFARLLDWPSGGLLRARGARRDRACDGATCPGTNVVETVFEAPDGAATLIDVLAVHPHATPEAPVGARDPRARSCACSRATAARCASA